MSLPYYYKVKFLKGGELVHKFSLRADGMNDLIIRDDGLTSECEKAVKIGGRVCADWDTAVVSESGESYGSPPREFTFIKDKGWNP
jgi:hypothetical protein